MRGAGGGEGQSSAADADSQAPRGVLAGLRYPLRGARFVYREHRGLARYWLPPVLITFALLVAAIVCALSLHDRATEALWSAPTTDGFWQSLQRVAHGAFELLVTLVLLGLGVLVVALLGSVIAAPFNDALSQAVEAIQRGHAPSSAGVFGMLRDALRGVALAALKLLVYAAVMLLLFLLGLLVPGLGSVVQTAVSAALTALFLALDHVDWSASRAGLDVRQRLALARGNLGVMLGFGAGVWLLLLIPFVNLLFMPAAVAGGTLLFLDLQGRGAQRA